MMQSAPPSTALFTDLYELTMAQAFHDEGMAGTAVFELFFRELPPERNYILACGFDDALAYLENFAFATDEIDWLAGTRLFSDAFLKKLATLRFEGDVFAVPEGTAVFAHEPVMQVVAPLPEAQLVETWLLNQIHYQSLVATKAARVVVAANGRPVMDFGARRAHGSDAANKAARAGYIGGLAGTSNVFAGRLYDIPLHGTMAHSYVQAHDDEAAALAAFVSRYPQTTVLVDTYDTMAGIDTVIRLATERGSAFPVGGIRIDSGDLVELSRRAREKLDAAGLQQVRIVLSGGLDEDKVARLVREAPVDAFGVGTAMVVSADRPSFDCAYKLVEYAGRPRLKASTSKLLLPGRKQIFRRRDGDVFSGDTLASQGETPAGEPLLAQVMQAGQRIEGMGRTARDCRAFCHDQIGMLPERLRRLDKAEVGYPVAVSASLRQLQKQELARLGLGASANSGSR
ncbi:MAG TPA: nicotinate phosphoribosyltransferase [Gammaproteobacteria bacterium]|nr:nicotinate phosphoribosyltransferase [Gammaproteobacteria bacterium]